MAEFAGNTRAESAQPPGLHRMKLKYNLEEGRVKCQCLIRKWKFCKHVKILADNKVSKSLLQTYTKKEVENMKILSQKKNIISDVIGEIIDEVTKQTQTSTNINNIIKLRKQQFKQTLLFKQEVGMDGKVIVSTLPCKFEGNLKRKRDFKPLKRNDAHSTEKMSFWLKAGFCLLNKPDIHNLKSQSSYMCPPPQSGGTKNLQL